MGKNPVIFLPTHRSYADFILMAFLCFNYDIEIPVVVAGMGEESYSFMYHSHLINLLLNCFFQIFIPCLVYRCY